MRWKYKRAVLIEHTQSELRARKELPAALCGQFKDKIEIYLNCEWNITEWITKKDQQRFKKTQQNLIARAAKKR